MHILLIIIISGEIYIHLGIIILVICCSIVCFVWKLFLSLILILLRISKIFILVLGLHLNYCKILLCILLAYICINLKFKIKYIKIFQDFNHKFIFLLILGIFYVILAYLWILLAIILNLLANLCPFSPLEKIYTH